jgi:hypothetical protein
MSQHLPEHANHTPSIERIREAHSSLSLSWFPKEGHYVYSQDGREPCYICVLLATIARLEAALLAAADALENAIADQQSVYTHNLRRHANAETIAAANAARKAAGEGA